MLEELHRTYETLQDTSGRLYLSPKSQAEADIVDNLRTDINKALKSMEDALGITAGKVAGAARKAREINRDKFLPPPKE